MTWIDSIAKKVEEYGTFACTVLGIVSLVYISQNSITDLTDKFTILSGSLLAFVAVFFTVIIISEFLTKLNTLNQTDINRLKGKIQSLSNQETTNLNSDKYEENTEICNKKVNIYNELSNIKERKINRFLFISAFLLIVMLILDSKFIPEVIFNIQNYKPYTLLIGLWIVVNYVLKITILFYKVYSD